ncbi:MAG TPA: hypothetical protein P5526_09135 [Anaerolineae bacterium]|nr:hypothetical protein [Anaerolineae bacterium]MCB0180284.1 hypothetical protein [Anaerolineae bacterium]MCB0223160.1 hypothetical protein [Anaerolineae bacterium]HRV92313.1 hypothetical protein [Anaerolineae bacterium]
MSYEVNAKQSYNRPAGQVSETASDLLVQLGGKPSDKNNPAKGQLEVIFNKKVKDRALPNRCQVRVKVVGSGDNTTLMAKVFPVDPMGNKLTFGVRGDATQIVMDTFLAELDSSLKS